MTGRHNFSVSDRETVYESMLDNFRWQMLAAIILIVFDAGLLYSWYSGALDGSFALELGVVVTAIATSGYWLAVQGLRFMKGARAEFVDELDSEER